MRYIDSSLLPEINDAKGDLAGRLAVAPATIEVARAERVTWPDGSLGCPRPGMLYTQALVRGYFVQLHANDRHWNYHGGRGGPPHYCDSPDERLPEDLPSGHLTI